MTFTVEVNWDKKVVGLPVRVRHIQSKFNVGGASQSLQNTFDVVNGDLIVIIGYTPHNTHTLSTPTWTGTGTVTLREAQTGETGHPNLYLWTVAVTATAVNRNITVAYTGDSRWGFTATVWRNHGGLGDTSKGFNDDPDNPILDLTTSAGSAVEIGLDNIFADSGADRNWVTIDGSPMIEQLFLKDPGNYTVCGAYRIDTGTEDVVDTWVTFPDGGGWSAVGGEILGLSSPSTDPDNNVSGLVDSIQGVNSQYGRDQSTALAPTVSGRGSLTLDNRDRRFSPRNTSSPIYGKVKPARPVKITRNVASVDYVVFVGHTDDTPINPDVEAKTVSLSLVDSLADFRGITISTALYAGLRTGEAISIILDECGWTGTRDLDNGATVLPWWWEDGTDALEALEKLIRCEGPPALMTIGSDGGFIFKDRHHRLLDSTSLTSQGTWWGVDGTTEPAMAPPFSYDDAWRNIINTGLVTVDVRAPGGTEAVWTSDSPIQMVANEVRTIIATSSDPFINAIEPEENTDYTMSDGSVSISLSRTSGGSTTITLVAFASGASLTNLQLRAQPVKTSHTLTVTASNDSSIYDYGARSFPNDLPFCNQHDAQAILDTAIEMRAQPLPIVATRFLIANNSARAALLSRDLSDRVTIVEDETALNTDFYIESISHQFSDDFDHEITVELEAAPPDGAVTAANVFLIGGGVGHQIGDGVLAR